MARRAHKLSVFIVVASALFANGANARSRVPQEAGPPAPIAAATPTLAPFQHVRFCLHYPSECANEARTLDRIEMNAGISDLLKHVNHDVNAAINPRAKTYGSDLRDAWMIAPASGDCNDYAVTKRHDLIASGLPAKALRLSVVKTTTGVGHLVLVVATSSGDLVMDNLTDAIRPWKSTSYQWLKIQSSADARFWYEIREPKLEANGSPAHRKLRFAVR